MAKQRGLVLFFALIALVVMSLAAVALIRSVDTSSMIAGNLAFKQAATTSADAGIEFANTWLETATAANGSMFAPNHPFNFTGGTNASGTGDWRNAGYHSNAVDDPAAVGYLDLFADSTWDDTNSKAAGTDTTGNTIRYLIQRMCRVADTPIQNADCLFSAPVEDGSPKGTPTPDNICKGAGCPALGQTPQLRITVRTSGPKNTFSYVQAFVY